MSPPGRSLITSTGPLPGLGDRLGYAQNKAARRDRAVLVQCMGCGANASGIARFGRIRSSTLTLVRGPRHLTHAGCGGRVHAVDIEVGR